MTDSMEYHIYMRPIPASVARLSVVAITLFFFLPPFVSSARAQINGVPASVTSPGFGGRAVNGPPASVTSLGPRGFAPGPQIPMASAANGSHRRDGHHRRHDGDNLGPVWYAVPVPYAIDNGAVDDDSEAGDNDPNYQGGPTVFDRRGSGARSYVPPMQDAPPAHARSADTDPGDPPTDPEPVQAATLLVFKDGHKLEVGNYAILGATLFDLTPGHSRKVVLADLDLEATRKANDDRGVTFQLPPSLQAN